jgi:hypothetical protein
VSGVTAPLILYLLRNGGEQTTSCSGHIKSINTRATPLHFPCVVSLFSKKTKSLYHPSQCCHLFVLCCITRSMFKSLRKIISYLTENLSHSQLFLWPQHVPHREHGNPLTSAKNLTLKIHVHYGRTRDFEGQQ